MFKYILSILVMSTSYGDISKEIKLNFLHISPIIQSLNPHISEKDADKYGKLIEDYSVRYGIDWKIIVAIIYQESNFKLDAANCSNSGCQDFGMVQINFRNIKRLKLNMGKLLTDPEYNIFAMSEMLIDLKKRFSKKDKRWFARYHSSTPSFKSIYYRMLKKHFKDIERILDEQKKDNNRRQRSYVPTLQEGVFIQGYR